MNTIRFNDKTDFVAALEARRGFWRAYDAKQAKDHAVAEKQWLVDTRSALREALKLDYKQLSNAFSGYGGNRLQLQLETAAPKCPRLQEKRLNEVIASLSYTRAKVFNVDSQGAWSDAHYLLTTDPYAPASVC